MKMLFTRAFYYWMLLLPFLFMTCSKDKDQPSGPAQLMFVNGLVGGHNSTVIIADSTYSALNAGFGNPSAYNKINSGNQNVKLKDNALDGIIATNSFNISAGKNYTLMAAGTNSNAELLIKEDDLSIEDTTKSYVRLINLSSNSLPITLYITAGADLATNVSYKSVSDFIAVAPAKYNVSIKAGSTIFSTIANLNLQVKKKYSILITGLINQAPNASYNIIANKQ